MISIRVPILLCWRDGAYWLRDGREPCASVKVDPLVWPQESPPLEPFRHRLERFIAVERHNAKGIAIPVDPSVCHVPLRIRVQVSVLNSYLYVHF